MSPDPQAGDWAAVAGDPEPEEPPHSEPAGLHEALLLLRWGSEHIGGDPERSRNWNHRHWQDAALAFLASERLTTTNRDQVSRAPLPDSPAPSLHRWLLFVGIGLALAGVWLVAFALGWRP